jgi:hypothetical protein
VAVLDPDPSASRSGRLVRPSRRLCSLLAVGLLALGAISIVLLASPEPARAIDIDPLDPIQDVVGAGVDAVTGGIGGMAVEGLGAVIKALFAWPAKIINRELLAWLVAVPDYAIHPETARAGHDGSSLAELGATTSAMAFAALGAVATVSAIRYWAAGLTGSGGLEAVEGLARTVAAALFIVLWPWLFRHAADLANAAGSGLLGSGSVLDDTARLLAVAFAAGVSFNILAILIAVAAAVLFLALLLTKIAVTATTALLFVGMPLAVMLWPIPELAWIARTAMRAFATVLAIPLLWAVCFATFAAVGIDALALKGAGKAVDALVMPLVAVALLWLTVVAPRTLARMAMFGAQGGGSVGRTASHLAARRADAAVAQKLPAALGGRAGGRGVTVDEPLTGPTPASPRRAGGLGGAASTVFGRQRARLHHQPGAAPTGRVPTAGGLGPPSPPGRWTPPEGFEHTTAAQGAGAPGTGLRNPSWQEIKDHVPVELAAAVARERSTTRGDVARAMRSLSPEARQGVMSLMESKGGQIRGQMAHQAARGDLTDSERDAFRTLAAASPEVRTHGIGDFIGAGADERPAYPAPPNGATTRTGEGSATPPMSQASHETSAETSPRVGGEDSSPIAAPLPDGGAMGPASQQPPPASRPDGATEGSSTPPPRDPNDGSRT